MESSPRSREIDIDNAAAWDDTAPPPAAGKVKLMCSYGGKIQPRPHDNQLTYVGGDTKILAVDRTMQFPAVLAKIASLAGAAHHEVCFKYQLPGEDLDALISVTDDEDLEHMMIEYDRLLRSSPKPVARLRLFLFPLAPPPPPSSDSSTDSKSDSQWFVDALNSVPSLNPTVISANHGLHESVTPKPPAQSIMVFPAGPDYLFGLDKGFVAPLKVKVTDQAPRPLQQQQPPERVTTKLPPPSKEERLPFVAEPQTATEMQSFQMAVESQEKAAAQAAVETISRVYPVEYCAPVVQEDKPAPPPPVSSQISAPTPASAPYLPETPRSMGGTARFASIVGGEHLLYLIPAAFPHVGQGYYPAVPRMVAGPTAAVGGNYSLASALSNTVTPAEGYYSVAPATSSPVGPEEECYSASTASSQPTAVAEGCYSVAPLSSQPVAAAVQTAVKVAASDSTTAYDNAGHAVYYATSAVPTVYQTLTSVGLPASDAAKIVKPPPVS